MFSTRQHNFLLFCVLSGLFFWLQFHIVIADEGFHEYYKLAKQINSQDSINKNIADKNIMLENNIAQLRSSKDVLESQARLKLGYVKVNESFYSYPNEEL